MTSYLGIDVSKATLDTALLREGHSAEAAQFANTRQGFTRLSHFLKKRHVQLLHACLEATGFYGDELAQFLYEAGYRVRRVNPARIKAYAGIPSSTVLQSLDAHIAFLDQQLTELLHQIHDHVDRHPHLRQQKPRLSKRGSARLRSVLYFPALVAQRHNPILRAFAQRLLAAGKPKLAVLTAVMRKLSHLIYGILKSGLPFDPNFLPQPAETA